MSAGKTAKGERKKSLTLGHQYYNLENHPCLSSCIQDPTEHFSKQLGVTPSDHVPSVAHCTSPSLSIHSNSVTSSPKFPTVLLVVHTNLLLKCSYLGLQVGFTQSRPNPMLCWMRVASPLTTLSRTSGGTHSRTCSPPSRLPKLDLQCNAGSYGRYGMELTMPSWVSTSRLLSPQAEFARDFISEVGPLLRIEREGLRINGRACPIICKGSKTSWFSCGRRLHPCS